MDQRIPSYFCKTVGQKYQDGCLVIHADELLSELCEWIFPFVDDSSQRFERLERLKAFVLEVTRSKKTREKLAALTEKALNGYFRENLSDLSIEERRQLLSFTAIVTVEDSGFISFPKPPKFYENFSKANVSLKPQHFGNIDNYAGVISKREQKVTNTRETVELTRQERSEAERSLDCLMQEIRQKEGYRKDLPSLWHLNLGKKEVYDKLKECLTDICGSQTRFNDAFWEKYSEAIAIYAACWFQWEFDGNTEKNAFSAINMNNKADEIIERIGLPPEFVYSARKNEKPLFSLYVRGGFPLRNEKFREICDTIFLWSEDEDDAITARILDDFGLSDMAFKQSLTNEDGSLHRYVEFLCENGKLPIVEEQEDESCQSIVAGWNKALKEGLEREIKTKYRKFELAWEAEYYEGNLQLMLLLSMKNNPQNSSLSEGCERHLIPANVLKDFNVGRRFRVIVKNGDAELRKISFYGQGTRDSEGNYNCYTSYYGYEKFVLASDTQEGYDFGVLECKTEKAWPSDHIQKGKIDFTTPIQIFIETESETYEYDKIFIDEPIKFRFDQLFSWNTTRNRGDLALFLPRKAAFKDHDMVFNPKQIANSGWLPITKALKGCTYNDKEIRNVVPYVDGQLLVEVMDARQVDPDVICHEDEKAVSYSKDGWEQTVLLLRNVNDIEVCLIKDRYVKTRGRFARKECITEKEIQKEYTAQYRQFDGDELKEVEVNDISPGYCEISIILNDCKKTTVAKCYVVGDRFHAQAATNDESCSDDGFENAYQRKDETCSDGGTLTYFVYKGAGLYNRYTKRKLGDKGGVFRHLDCYYYRNSKGGVHALFQEYKSRAWRKVYNDIDQVNHDGGNQNIVLRISKDSNTFTIQPFSNKRIEVTDSCEYRVPLNAKENGLEGCTFYYCTFDDILKVNEVKSERIEITKNAKYVYLDFQRSASHNGLLFQSLKDIPGDDSTSEYYFRPLFVPKVGGEKKIGGMAKANSRRDNIEKEYYKLKSNNYKDAINAFLLSTEHKLYYTSMDALCALVVVPEPTILIEFYLEYIKCCQEREIEIDYNALYALSDELLFNWWFIPQVEWKKYKKEHQDAIERLLRANPCLSSEEDAAKTRLVEKFWNDFKLPPEVKNKKNNDKNNEDKEKEKLASNSRTVARSIASKRNDTSVFNKEDWSKINERPQEFSFIEVEKILKTK